MISINVYCIFYISTLLIIEILERLGPIIINNYYAWYSKLIFSYITNFSPILPVSNNRFRLGRLLFLSSNGFLVILFLIRVFLFGGERGGGGGGGGRKAFVEFSIKYYRECS